MSFPELLSRYVKVTRYLFKESFIKWKFEYETLKFTGGLQANWRRCKIIRESLKNRKNLQYLSFELQRQRIAGLLRQTKEDYHHEKTWSVLLLSCETASAPLLSMNPLPIAIFLLLRLIEPTRYVTHKSSNIHVAYTILSQPIWCIRVKTKLETAVYS